MERAVHQLAGVSGKLDRLLEGEHEGMPSAGEPRPAPARSAQSIASEAERRLLARDAHAGATMFAAILVGAAPVVILTQRSVSHSMLLFGAATVSGSLLLAYLVITRRRPSERRLLIVVLLLFGLTLPIVSYNQWSLLMTQRPYSPFVGHKILLVTLALAVASRLWLGLLLMLVTTVDALVLYFALHLGAHKDRIPLAEPWLVLVFLVIGIVALVMRDQRRVASVRLLRDEAEASALHRRALMFFALRDQLNSPLQTLVLCAARLDRQHSPQEVARVRAGIDRLVALSRELAELDQLVPSGPPPASLDAPDELRRHR
jgi:hypothetical protein